MNKARIIIPFVGISAIVWILIYLDETSRAKRKSDKDIPDKQTLLSVHPPDFLGHVILVGSGAKATKDYQLVITFADGTEIRQDLPTNTWLRGWPANDSPSTP